MCAFTATAGRDKSVCTAAFALRMHLAIHAAERGEITCGVCAKEFSDFSELDRHLKAHLGSRLVKGSSEKVHPCPTCGKSFFAKDIRRHRVVHTRNRDFLCQYCPCQFGRHDHLVRHMRLAHREGGRHGASEWKIVGYFYSATTDSLEISLACVLNLALLVQTLVLICHVFPQYSDFLPNLPNTQCL